MKNNSSAQALTLNTSAIFKSLIPTVFFAFMLSISSGANAQSTDIKSKTQSIDSKNSSVTSNGISAQKVIPLKDKKASAVLPERISIMSFNVENLFDTIDDPNTED